jgi:four helix bundle protein
MRNDKENVIVVKTLDFAVSIVGFCEKLEEQKKYSVSKQLLRSGTSIGANVFEAQNAESKADFIHKMKIAAKEASETQYWLMLCDRCDQYHYDEQLMNQLNEIIRILSSIISTSKTGFKGLMITIALAFSNFQIFKFSH